MIVYCCFWGYGESLKMPERRYSFICSQYLQKTHTTLTKIVSWTWLQTMKMFWRAWQFVFLVKQISEQRSVCFVKIYRIIFFPLHQCNYIQAVIWWNYVSQIISFICQTKTVQLDCTQFVLYMFRAYSHFPFAHHFESHVDHWGWVNFCLTRSVTESTSHLFFTGLKWRNLPWVLHWLSPSAFVSPPPKWSLSCDNTCVGTTVGVNSWYYSSCTNGIFDMLMWGIEKNMLL